MRKIKPIYTALISAILVFQGFSMAPAGSAAVGITGEYVPNQIIVGYRATNSASEIAAVKEQTRRDVAARSFSQISPLARDTELIELGQGLSVSDALSRLSGRPGIRFVEPNFIYTSFASSNDAYFTNGSLWGMYGSLTAPSNQFGSNAAAAWEKGYTGSSDVVIGVIDEGIQINHFDLQANIWSNPYDAPGDRIDNDGNGFIDDINGWDFVSDDNSVYDGADDDHGTHVAGTIGAEGANSEGVAGVNWAIKMISAKFLGVTGGTTANAIKAVDYLTDLKVKRGVNIVATSNSWGGGGYSQGLLDAINRGGDAGILFIAAAGNSTVNLDKRISYPAGYQCTTSSRSWDCVLSVASITSSGALSSFSNYGASSVDLGAPGSGIWSTLPNGTYGLYSGTSMATPHVSGAAAMCKSVNLSITASEIQNAILSSAVATSSLTGKTVTGGRLDVSAMVEKCKPPSTNLTISTTVIPSGWLNSSYSAKIVASGGSGENYFSLVDANTDILPDGLVLESDGSITGIPTKVGIYNFRIKVTDSSLSTDSKSFRIQILSPLAITTGSLPNTLLRSTYRETLIANGGNGEYMWIRSAGLLPTGLSLSSTGVISGKSSKRGTFIFTVRVSDTMGSQPAEKQFQIVVS